MKILTAHKNTTILALIFLLAFNASKVSAQDPSAGKLKCTFTMPVGKNVTDAEAYEMATAWFNKNAAQLTRSNIAVSAQNAQCNNAANLAEVNHEFNNTHPVQSFDPESNRMTAKMVTKYFGANGGTIKALYLQCYIVVTVVDHNVVCEIKDMRYNHFNERNYQFKRIQNWGNSTSLDAVNTFDYLVANEQSHEEFNKYYSFLNKEVNQLMAGFSGYMSGALTSN